MTTVTASPSTGPDRPAQPEDPNRRHVPFARTYISEAARCAALEVLQCGWVTSGPRVLEFEDAFATTVGATRAVAVSSCTAAIELALRGLQLPAQTPVLVSANTFCGAVGAILHAGLRPHLVDVDIATGTPNETTTASAAAGIVGPRAMLVVHLAGYPADVRSLAAAADVGLDCVVEDAAHAMGTTVNDQPVGSISRATCFSFYATKNLAIGEGGMLTTDDEALADYASCARLHGMSRDAWRRYLPGGGWRYDVQVEGLKANMTDVQAAIGLAQLRDFDRTQGRRRHVADRYDQLLTGLRGLTLPPRPSHGRHAWHLYAVRVRPDYGISRDRLISALADRGIGSSVHFTPVHHLTWYANRCRLPRGGLPGANTLFTETMSLPLDSVIDDDDVDAVTSALFDLGDRP